MRRDRGGGATRWVDAGGVGPDRELITAGPPRGRMEIAAFVSLHPIGEGESVGDAVAEAVQVIRDSGLEHHLGPSGTTIRGEWEEVFEVLKRCHEVVSGGEARVSSVIKVDCKPDGFGDAGIAGKVERVEERLDG